MQVLRVNVLRAWLHDVRRPLQVDEHDLSDLGGRQQLGEQHRQVAEAGAQVEDDGLLIAGWERERRHRLPSVREHRSQLSELGCEAAAAPDARPERLVVLSEARKPPSYHCEALVEQVGMGTVGRTALHLLAQPAKVLVVRLRRSCRELRVVPVLHRLHRHVRFSSAEESVRRRAPSWQHWGVSHERF